MGEVRAAMKVGEGEVRLFARRLADMGGMMGMHGALQAVSVEVADGGLRAAVLEVAREIGEEGARASEAFARRPEYFPGGFVEAVRMLEATGEYHRTVGRWANTDLIDYQLNVAPHVERMRGLVAEYPALFDYHEGDNPHERVVVLLERLTRRRDLVEALTER